VTEGPAEHRLAARLLAAGVVHPKPSGRPPTLGLDDLTMVIPVHNDAAGLSNLLPALAAEGETTSRCHQVIVVDDGSSPAEAARLEKLLDQYAITMLRNNAAMGPAAARNRGAAIVTTRLVGFVDADVHPTEGWLDALLWHFDNPSVTLVAPRVRAMPGSSVVDRYEAVGSPLDLGPRPGLIKPQSRISYVPGAAMVMRTATFNQLDGFDEALRAGEDVDLVWRVGEQPDSLARYEPRGTVHHRNRQSLTAFSRQRHLYGSATAPLEHRHPGWLSPVVINKWSAAVVALPVLLGRRGLGVGAMVAIASAATMVPKIRDRVDQPVSDAMRLGLRGHLHAAEMVANAAWRDWLPATVVAAAVSPRVRRAAAVAALAPAAAEWLRDPPSLDPVRYAALRTLDNASHGAGVITGLIGARSIKAVLPRWTLA